MKVAPATHYQIYGKLYIGPTILLKTDQLTNVS